MKKKYISITVLMFSLSVSFAQNQQLYYDGENDKCYIPDAEVLFSNLEIFTVEVWLKPFDISNSPIFIGSSSNEILFGIDNNYKDVCISTNFINGNTFVKSFNYAFTDVGVWHHIAYVRSGTGSGHGKIYIDGVDKTSPYYNTTGVSIPMTGDLELGISLTSFELNGSMDELRIWNVARTQTEINDNMNFELTGSEPGLIGYWKFNEGSGQIILDTQTNGVIHNGTLGATANPGSDDPTRIQDPTLPLPVELVSFVSNLNANNVELSWITASEINNMGFDIERKTESSSYAKIGFVSGNGTTTDYSYYSFVDVISQPGVYLYRLKQIDFDGSFKYSNEIRVEIESVPLTFNLEQNYPNPFNPTTKISYALPETGFVNLTVYNSLGEKVTELVNEVEESGKHNVIFLAGNLSSGLYIYKLSLSGERNTYTISKVMSLVK